MTIATTIIIIFTLLAIIVFLTLSIINWKKLRQPIVTGKTVDNRLYKFTDNHRFGTLIKKVPVGKNKNLYRIHFTVKEKDEYDNLQIVEKIVVADQRYLMEDEHLLVICPKDITDSKPSEMDGKKIGDFIRKQNGIDLIAEATKQDKDKFMEKFINSYGAETTITELELSNTMKIIEIINSQKKDKEEDTKKS